MRITLLTIMLSAMCLNMQAQTGDMNVFVSQLMSRMTLEEKLGQLNLAPASDEIVTGGAVNTEVGQRIANGQLGGVLNGLLKNSRYR